MRVVVAEEELLQLTEVVVEPLVDEGTVGPFEGQPFEKLN